MITTEQLQTKIAKLQEQLKAIKQKELEEANKQSTLIIKELKIEVETKLHIEIDRINKTVIPTGWRLLELSELIFIYNNYQDKFNWGEDKIFDEITKQPIKDCKYPYFNVWLHGLGDAYGSGLNGISGNLNYNNRVRGVRFCRDLKAMQEKQ